MSLSERLVATARHANLHPVTWIIVWTTVAHVVGDTLYALEALEKLFRSNGSGPPTTAEIVRLIASIVHAYSYSVLFIASAATVEFLFRILQELKAGNARRAEG